jgi:hypothetical protein
MSTRIRIERLVLDGIELSRRERDALGPAIARELRRLAGEQAHELAGEQAHEQADLRGEPRHRGASPAVDGIAREVAAGVHRVMPAARPAPGVARGGHR